MVNPTVAQWKPRGPTSFKPYQHSSENDWESYPGISTQQKKTRWLPGSGGKEKQRLGSGIRELLTRRVLKVKPAVGITSATRKHQRL